METKSTQDALFVCKAKKEPGLSWVKFTYFVGDKQCSDIFYIFDTKNSPVVEQILEAFILFCISSKRPAGSTVNTSPWDSLYRHGRNIARGARDTNYLVDCSSEPDAQGYHALTVNKATSNAEKI
jgi:hypothetical protein